MVSECIWTLGRLSLRGITAFFISFIVVLHFKEASSFVPFNFHVFTKQLKMPMPTRMFKECFWVVLQIKCREAEPSPAHPSPAQPSPAGPPAAGQPRHGQAAAITGNNAITLLSWMELCHMMWTVYHILTISVCRFDLNSLSSFKLNDHQVKLVGGLSIFL